MKIHPLLALAVSSLFAATPSWAARGGGHVGGAVHMGGGGAIHSSAAVHTSAPQVSHTAIAHSSPRNTSASARSFNRQEHSNFRGNRHYSNYVAAGYAYPWWLYDSGYPYTNPYGYSYPPTTTSSDNESMTDNGASAASGPSGVDFNEAESTMAQIANQQRAAMESSLPWQQAVDQMKLAREQLTTAQDELKTRLMNRPDYRAAVEQKREAEARAETLHATDSRDDAAVFVAAQDDLNASAKIARIEREAQASDAALVQARVNLQAAATAQQAMRQNLKASILNDPAFQSAKQSLSARQ